VVATLPSLCFAVLLAGLTAPPAVQTADDPTVRAAVERYYKALETEDIEGYLSLWSQTASRPQLESLKFLFESADERFYDIEIVRAVMAGDRLRVRVSVKRERTRPSNKPGEPPLVMSSVAQTALTFVKEGEAWMVVSEGSPADDLARAVVAAGTPEERDALLASEPDLQNVMLVVAAARIASQAAVMRQYAKAQVLYERVVELAKRTGSLREEGDALQNLGNTLYFQGKMTAALTAYEERLTLEQQRADDAAVAAALVGIATTKYSIAEYSDALKRYRQALAIQERLDDRPSSAGTLIGIANIRFLQGDYASAIRDYSRSREFYRAYFDTDGDARALEGLGRTYSAQGNYASALAAFDGVLAEGRARSDRSRQANATRSIAEVHLRLGNVDAARKFYEESRDHLEALKDLGGAGRVWQGLGMTELLAGRYDAAEKAYTRSMTVCGGIKDDECSAHALVGLAFALSAQEKFTDAIPTYRKAVDAFTTLGEREATARAEIGLSQALVGANEVEAALEAAARARRTAVGLSLDDVLWRALTAEARALRKGTRTREALAAARAAAGVVERMHAAALEKPATAIPSDAPRVFATLAILQAENGDPVAAWASVTTMRAAELRFALAVNEREIARGMSADEREQERAAAADLLSLLAQADRERRLPKPDKLRLEALDKRIAESVSVRAEWMADLYTRLPDLRVWRGLAAPPSAEDLLALLTPDTVALEFVVDDDDVLVMVASGTPESGVRAHVAPIRRRALAERVSALLRAGTLRDAVAWRKAASEITRLLPESVLPLLAGASKVIVFPHDVIWRVPFEALPLGDGYLGDRAQVVLAGSRQSIVRAAATAQLPVQTLVAVGAPDLMPATMERLKQTAPGWALRAADASNREASALALNYGEQAVVLAGSSATEAALRSNAASASVIHVAAPFRINGASPLFSPILLSGDPSKQLEEDDGALETREVMNQSLQARVTVLPDGAATSMLDGASAANVVQWAWLAAGVPSVVIARWTADPAVSDVLLAEFHRRVRTGVDPAEAMLGARRTVRTRAEWAAPFYWAGWIVLGS
jgi:tetratricopeptide (TPR) repeat protein/CHAT domain-containing protein